MAVTFFVESPVWVHIKICLENPFVDGLFDKEAIFQYT